jgi:phage terminase large subunit-like protein
MIHIDDERNMTIKSRKQQEGGMETVGIEKTAAEEEQKESPRHRLQLDFSPEAYSRLLEVRRKSDARTNAEVVRNALRVYEWFLEQKQNKYKLQLVKGDTLKEVEIVL